MKRGSNGFMRHWFKHKSAGEPWGRANPSRKRLKSSPYLLLSLYIRRGSPDALLKYNNEVGIPTSRRDSVGNIRNICRGSSVVEQTPEERRVGCSIHPRGTMSKRQKQKIPARGFFVYSNIYYSFFTFSRSLRFLSIFGSFIVRSPFLSDASAPSTSTSQGRSIEREKLPQYSS